MLTCTQCRSRAAQGSLARGTTVALLWGTTVALLWHYWPGALLWHYCGMYHYCPGQAPGTVPQGTAVVPYGVLASGRTVRSAHRVLWHRRRLVRG